MISDPSPDDGTITLRFLAAPTDVALLGGTGVAGGRVLEWVDKAAYACAVAWGGGYCVTAYVGNVHFRRPIHSGDLVEVTAQLVLTGRSSMHVQVTVRAAPVATRIFTETTSCLVVFVAVGEDGRPSPVRPWTPPTPELALAEEDARARVDVRRSIEEAMAAQAYTDASQAPSSVMRFLAAPTDVNWGGKTHGGTVMRWIDDAAWACAVGWSGTDARSVFSGGIRFYRPIPIGNLVEVRARMLHTGRTSMHLSVHVLTADPKVGEYALTTHSLTVFVALDGGRPVPTPSWVPQTEEDQRLDAHAVHLMELRRN